MERLAVVSKRDNERTTYPRNQGLGKGERHGELGTRHGWCLEYD